MGVFGLTVLVAHEEASLQEPEGTWQFWGNALCYADDFGWICILVNLCILPGFSKHCSVIPALAVVRENLFPTWPLLLHPACHRPVLQAGDADLQDKKIAKDTGHCSIPILIRTFFHLTILACYCQELFTVLKVSEEVNPFILFFNAFWYLRYRKLLWVHSWDLFDAQGMPRSCVVFSVTVKRTKGRETVRN